MAKITEYLELILEGQDLSFEQAESLLDVILEGWLGGADCGVSGGDAGQEGGGVGSAGLATSLRKPRVPVKRRCRIDRYVREGGRR
jgi:hypothetical protein